VSEMPVAHASDCAVHNAPAYEPGPCDCGAARPPVVAEAMIHKAVDTFFNNDGETQRYEATRLALLAALAVRGGGVSDQNISDEMFAAVVALILQAKREGLDYQMQMNGWSRISVTLNVRPAPPASAEDGEW
jgi:hypothetical protein